MSILLDPMTASDWPAVKAIYKQGIATGHATFETHSPETWEMWSKSKIPSCCILAREEATVLGWATLTRISGRCAYAGVAEVSIYVAGAAHGRGIGSLLLEELVRRSEANGLWTLQASIFPENQASLRLHLKHGFRQVGVRERIGRMNFGPYQGRWRDTLLLERRSTVVGVDS